jgi:competence protein ComEA
VTVDINEATQDDLDAVPGLHGHGFEIVRYRTDRGRFDDLRQLNEVPGLAAPISAATLEHLSVGQA